MARSATTQNKAAQKKVKILRVVCRPEGTFLNGRIYTIDEKLAAILIKNGSAKEEK